jgi:hypothetical protein
MQHLTLEKGLATFLNALSGKNRSAATIRAYSADIAQFITFLHASNVSIQKPEEVEKIDVVEYLSALAKRELTPKFCAKFWGFKTHQIALSGMPALALREDETPSGATSRAVPLQS